MRQRNATQEAQRVRAQRRDDGVAVIPWIMALIARAKTAQADGAKALARRDGPTAAKHYLECVRIWAKLDARRLAVRNGAAQFARKQEMSERKALADTAVTFLTRLAGAAEAGDAPPPETDALEEATAAILAYLGVILREKQDKEECEASQIQNLTFKAIAKEVLPPGTYDKIERRVCTALDNRDAIGEADVLRRLARRLEKGLP
jgi:MoxR-like ATPase